MTWGRDGEDTVTVLSNWSDLEQVKPSEGTFEVKAVAPDAGNEFSIVPSLPLHLYTSFCCLPYSLLQDTDWS